MSEWTSEREVAPWYPRAFGHSLREIFICHCKYSGSLICYYKVTSSLHATTILNLYPFMPLLTIFRLSKVQKDQFAPSLLSHISLSLFSDSPHLQPTHARLPLQPPIKKSMATRATKTQLDGATAGADGGKGARCSCGCSGAWRLDGDGSGAR